MPSGQRYHSKTYGRALKDVGGEENNFRKRVLDLIVAENFEKDKRHQKTLKIP